MSDITGAGKKTSVQHRRVSHLAGSFLIFYEARHRRSAAVSCRFGPREKQLNVAGFIFGSLNLIPVLLRESRRRRRKRTGPTTGRSEGEKKRNERPQLRGGSFVSCRSLARDGLFKSRRPLDRGQVYACHDDRLLDHSLCAF